MYLIWSLLNITLSLYFIYLLVGYVSKGRRILPKNKLLKTAAAILLIVGVAQFFKNITKENPQDTKPFIINERPKGIDKKNFGHYKESLKQITLEDNVPFNINATIRILFFDGKYIALNNTSGFTGLVSGFAWKQTGFPLVQFDKDGVAHYDIDGVLEWNLLGMNIYTESKTFIGTFKLDSYNDLEEYKANKKRKEQQLVLGTWVNEEDHRITWTFTENYTCNWYTASKLSDRFNYSLSKNPIQCGYEVKTEESEPFTYLKLTDTSEDKSEYCYEIFGVNDSILSINYLPTSKIHRFKKLKNN